MKTLEALLQKPDEEFSLTEAALAIAKNPDLNNDFDIQEYMAKINQMADELKQRIGGKREPEEVISEINNYLFQEEDFYNKGNFFLNKVLDDKKGSSEGLSSLYLALAEQLDLPIYGVILPSRNIGSHMIVRWDDGKFKRNIETTYKGEAYTDLDYIIDFNISKESIEKGVYLRNLSKKEVVGNILNERGLAYAKEGDLEKAIQDYNTALELNPNFAKTYYNRGNAFAAKEDLEKAIQDYNKALELNPNLAGAYYNLGFFHADKGDYNKAIQYFQKVLDINPGYEESYNNRGSAHFMIFTLKKKMRL